MLVESKLGTPAFDKKPEFHLSWMKAIFAKMKPMKNPRKGRVGRRSIQ